MNSEAYSSSHSVSQSDLSPYVHDISKLDRITAMSRNPKSDIHEWVSRSLKFMSSDSPIMPMGRLALAVKPSERTAVIDTAIESRKISAINGSLDWVDGVDVNKVAEMLRGIPESIDQTGSYNRWYSETFNRGFPIMAGIPGPNGDVYECLEMVNVAAACRVLGLQYMPVQMRRYDLLGVGDLYGFITKGSHHVKELVRDGRVENLGYANMKDGRRRYKLKLLKRIQAPWELLPDDMKLYCENAYERRFSSLPIEKVDLKPIKLIDRLKHRLLR